MLSDADLLVAAVPLKILKVVAVVPGLKDIYYTKRRRRSKHVPIILLQRGAASKSQINRLSSKNRAGSGSSSLMLDGGTRCRPPNAEGRICDYRTHEFVHMCTLSKSYLAARVDLDF